MPPSHWLRDNAYRLVSLQAHARFVMEIVPDPLVGDLTIISTIDVHDSPQEYIFYPSSMRPNPNPEHCACMLKALDLRRA